jgi:hypothetical protein
MSVDLYTVLNIELLDLAYDNFLSIALKVYRDGLGH